MRIALEGLRFDEAMLEAAVARFHEEHRRHYGHASPQDSVHVVNLRLRARRPRDLASRGLVESSRRQPMAKGQRAVHFAEVGALQTATFNRDDLVAGDVVEGPAAIEEYGAVTLLPPGSRAEVASSGSLVVHVGGQAA